MNVHYPRSIRLKGYDYAQAGAYFVTICTQDRVCLFGDIVDGAMILGAPGQIVLEAWRELPEHYPHVRLDEVVRALKTFSSRRTNAWRHSPGIPLWQRNYYEHVVRNDRDLDRIREYITTNPLKWALDRENPQRTGHSAEEDALFDLDRAP